MKIIIAITLLSFSISTSFANSYAKKSPAVRTFIAKETVQKYLTLSKGKSLFTISYTPKKVSSNDVILIIPGWSEPVLFYDELIYDLKNLGISIIGYDHPSQGLSYRNLDDARKTHVKDFDEYITALDFVYKHLIAKFDRIFVISHSMGSHLATRYEMKNPGSFNKIAMLSPLLQINTRILPNHFAQNVVNKMISLGAGEWFVAPPLILNQFKYSMALNNGTRSKARFEGRNYWIKKYPNMISSGPTWHWLKQMMTANERLFQSYRKLKLPPTILMQAGNDTVVRNDRQNEFCIATSCRFIKLDNAKHWVHRELDDVREVILKELTDFFSKE